jgi:plasmid maintenance system killer protein
MDLVFTQRFDRSLRKAPAAVQRAFWKQLEFLVSNLNHPSLHAKKYGGAEDLWQARVNRAWRFYFKLVSDKCHLVDITAHPK